MCYLSVIPAAGILFGQVISNLLIEVKDGILLELYERHPAFLGVVPALALLFYCGACLPVTTKEDAAMHGIGLANVRRIAEKYMGGLEAEFEEQVFTVTVILQNIE